MSLMTTQPKAITPSLMQAELQKLYDGVRELLPAGVEFPVRGGRLDQAGIEARLRVWLNAFEAVALAKKAYTDAVEARRAITVEAREFEKGLKSTLRSYFGCESAALECFGIAADKPVVFTREQQLAAAAKRAKTRQERGTCGRRTKLTLATAGTPPTNPAPAIGPLTLAEAVQLASATDEEE